jgi:hypothetical protein
VGRCSVAVALACLAGTLAIPRGSGAASTVEYSAEARWYSAAPDDRSKVLSSGGSAPVSIGSLTPNDGRGGPCPDPSTNDYLCLRAYAAADLAALHAAARLTRKNVIGPVGHFARGVATVTFQQMTVVSPVPVVSGYVFLGLGGSATSSSSTGASPLLAYAEVYVNDTSACLGASVCEPFRIPNFDGSFLSVELFVYVAVNESNQVPVDATADADYVDTLTVQAIELHDANDQKIPDAVVTLTDGSGNATFTFPNSVQATTTSTTTVPGASTTTTTAPPGGCEVTATYPAIECRLAALDALVKASAGKLAPKLSKQLAKATGAIQKAAQPGTAERRVAKALRKAAQALRGYDTVLGSKKAKRLLDEGTRSSLQAAGAAIASDVAKLP